MLRQLRAGYVQRPGGFPQSVVLCGVRDVRDYRIHSSTEQAVVTGGGAFNIRAESLRLGDFTEAEVRALVAQHTEETGQAFTAEALETVWRQTLGQPWLVNALCARACFGDKAGRDRSRAITAEAVMAAREHLVQSRQVHLDQLADKLQEERVRRVVEPLLSGGDERGSMTRDIEYVRDLGLIARDAPLRIANPVYAEVVPRELTWAMQQLLLEETAWYVDADGGLDVDKLLGAFQTFFREHSEHWLGRFDYAEAGPQLVLQGFLQRVVNGGGRIEREYGLGRGRIDLLIVWPRGGAGAAPGTGESGSVRGGVQGAAQEPGADRCRGCGADGGVHGSVRCAGGTSGRVRPARGSDVGGEGLPARGSHRRARRHRVGDVGARGNADRGRTDAFATRAGSTVATACDVESSSVICPSPVRAPAAPPPRPVAVSFGALPVEDDGIDTVTVRSAAAASARAPSESLRIPVALPIPARSTFGRWPTALPRLLRMPASSSPPKGGSVRITSTRCSSPISVSRWWSALPESMRGAWTPCSSRFNCASR